MSTCVIYYTDELRMLVMIVGFENVKKRWCDLPQGLSAGLIETEEVASGGCFQHSGLVGRFVQLLTFLRLILI